ncbi:CDP-alcohol phosphatidyltransferase family protein [Mesobaculum littorinae]|uniref:CDP-alcohol phosphatidyltransferase family protein n=2 Tax=Mesobaculum littorinae TaxID=2486419 RepID=A0A438AG44_9RHOB|nr:CDP-alcohol phosphatidyltransferase family protein [Mesobaculum littorinae]
MARDYPHAQLGGANLVTTLRLAFCAAMAAAMAAPGGPAAQAGWPAWGPTLLALLALSLDGIDGWLARRQALSSQFGARYDMEVDSALAAVLAALLVARGTAGPEMLVLGGARYAFVAAAQLLPWLGAPLPESLRRKTVCVVQIAALVALTAPILPVAADRPIAIGAALLVAWSFAVDIRWLVRRG